MVQPFDEAVGDKLIEGVEGCLAIKRAGSEQIELWGEEFERQLGCVPGNFCAAQINVVMSFLRVGYRSGFQDGKLAQQHEVQRKLGISVCHYPNVQFPH